MTDKTKRRSGPLLRLGKKFRPLLNRWIERSSLISTTPILDETDLAWTAHLKANWRIVQGEYDALVMKQDAIPPLGEIATFHRRIAPDNKWRSFFFEAHGYEAVGNRAQCPKTAGLLDQIPDLITAFFSVMEPGTHVPRHKGFTKALLNIHLGLRVPSGIEECRIQVADQDRGWEEGQILMFDESFPHEVWNDGDQSRAVLFIQVLRPMKWDGRLIAAIAIRFMNMTNYVQQARRSIGATPKRRSRGHNS